MLKQPIELAGRKPLVQFRAGKMVLANGVVTADPRKGVFSMVQEPTGALLIVWSPETGESESFVVLCGEATFNRVVKCTTGRVFVLNIGGHRELFFWLQERSEERDEEYLKKVKQFLGDKGNKPLKDRDSQSKSESKPSSNLLQLDDFQRILSRLGTEPRHPQVSIQDIISSKIVLDALRDDPAFFMSRLFQHLPEGTAPDADVVEQVRNEQVSGAAALLQAALSDPSGFHEVTSAFSLQGSQDGGTDEFIRRIIEEAKKKKHKQS
jgi:hypothetical protein